MHITTKLPSDPVGAWEVSAMFAEGRERYRSPEHEYARTQIQTKVEKAKFRGSSSCC